MNKVALYHISDYPYSEYLGGMRHFVRLRVAKEDRDLGIGVYYGNKYDFPEKRHFAKLEMREIDAEFAYFEAVLQLDDRRLGYVFSIRENGQEYFYSESGLTQDYDFKVSYRDFFQCPYCHESMAVHVPAWAYRACFYQIFVDRFRIGDRHKDLSYAKMKWGAEPSNKYHAGGDLRGIIESLDYLKGLGINALYITPIFLSKSYHKYDTIDYFQVDPRFGKEEDLKELIKKAHDRGIRIVLDAVFNHISSESPYFQDVLEKGKDSPYYGMFYLRGEKPDIGKANYETFSNCAYMPKINAESKQGESLLTKVAFHYLDMGIDGWRLDVADEVSRRFWRKLRVRVKERHPDALLLGEMWHDGHAFLSGDEFDGVMNYPFTYAAEDYLAAKKKDAKQTSDRLNYLLTTMREGISRMSLNHLDSHDTHRFLTLAKNDPNALSAAIALLVFYKGMPCIYYGTEIPLDGGYDPGSRRCFDYEAAQANNPFRQLLRDMLDLRKSDVLSYGDITVRDVGGLLSVKRTYKGETLELLINSGEEEASASNEGIAYSFRARGGRISENGFIIRRIQHE